MAKSTREIVAQRIRSLRQARGWSQEDLAEICNMHRTYIGDIERAQRNVSIDNIERLAHALKVEINELFRE